MCRSLFFVRVLLVLLFFSIEPVYAQISSSRYQIDQSLHLIICNEIPVISDSVTTIIFDQTYTFSSPVTSIQTATSYSVEANEITYQLFFTRLPLISLTASGSIQSDSEIGGTISVIDTTGNTYSSDMGIKIRGSYSSTLPKKSYRVQLWTDSTGSETKDESLLGMRSDKRWLFLAMYNEKLRFNNKMSHELWFKMHTLYYADEEPEALATIHTCYVDVFLDGAYQGVYLFAENMDRKQLKLQKQKTAGTGGELYKGDSWGAGTIFSSVDDLPTTTSETWSGWELSYPDETDWVNLRNLEDFVINSSDSLFKENVSTNIREDNVADYFIFLNLIRAQDNVGKNMFLARYDESSPYFVIPWDLDGTWGYYYDGSQKNTTNDILTSGLFSRLISTADSFKINLSQRWFALRETTLSNDSLLASIDYYYTYLKTNAIYDREALVWSGDMLSYSDAELAYMKTWTTTRLTWLDYYFSTYNEPAITNFNAVLNESVVNLSWNATCSIISSFDVERSADNLNWEALTTSSLSSTDSLICSYTFTDTNPLETTAYYRIQGLDLSGNTIYSSTETVSVLTSSTEAILVYPNPVSSTLQISGNLSKVSVYSMKGALVYEADNSLPNTINMQNLPVGLYIVYVTKTDGSISKHKIIVGH
ncbi:MAG: CotH kinase family protein [Siphonobacter sp.]